ncbi:hypothetical protein [Bradyrhizobium sp. CB3481]|uniref:hypothetical protein n=1 Tax=Bradyrhizobium sp. CB3481 TaxID=3039158 RepID=UPI0024B27569|nr:hypothetical protein [Bradyrhizobium sp. CB3481]WFU17752.1 hypothetical protein QA643_05230 [Bradyrhizobium sp. CB3481]
MRKQPHSTMTKNIGAAVALAMLWLCSGPALAAENNCMASYYRSKSPACVDETLAQFRQMVARSAPDNLVGFLAELFRASPDERERLLKNEPSNNVRQVYVYSLYRAGLAEEAKKYAAASQLTALLDKLQAARVPVLEAVRPSEIPGDNDTLIGAYMASGNTVFIQRILDNYAGADDAMVSDALRMAYMMSKFGNTLTPKGRDDVMTKAACEKYQCKVDPQKFRRLLTLASAFWSTQSLSAGDEGIKTTMSDFFTRDARLKNLLGAEQAAFGNYMTAIMLITTFKDKRQGADQERAFELMNKSASIYEHFGSGKEAFEPFMNLKK